MIVGVRRRIIALFRYRFWFFIQDLLPGVAVSLGDHGKETAPIPVDISWNSGSVPDSGWSEYTLRKKIILKKVCVHL